MCLIGDLSADFVPRPVEHAALKTAVRSEAPNKAAAVIGAGGYGKTMLVNALCRDPDVRLEFSDGIVRPRLMIGLQSGLGVFEAARVVQHDGRGFAVMLKTANLLPKGGCRKEVFDPR